MTLPSSTVLAPILVSKFPIAILFVPKSPAFLFNAVVTADNPAVVPASGFPPPPPPPPVTAPPKAPPAPPAPHPFLSPPTKPTPKSKRPLDSLMAAKVVNRGRSGFRVSDTDKNALPKDRATLANP